MTDLAKGIIEIDGFVITPKTTQADIEALPNDKVKIDISKRGNKYFTLLTPIVAGGISMYIEPYFKEDGTLDSLIFNPVIPVDMPYKDQQDGARNALTCSKMWLNGIAVDVVPTANNERCIYYKFDIVEYYASIFDDRDYGVRFNALKATFCIR